MIETRLVAIPTILWNVDPEKSVEDMNITVVVGGNLLNQHIPSFLVDIPALHRLADLIDEHFPRGEKE